MRKIYLSLIISLLLLISPAEALAATLTLNPSNATFNRGCYGSIKVDLDTAGAQTDGTDVILQLAPATTLAQVSIANGTIYNEYPGSNVDPATGKITIAGLASVTTPFTGKGTLATINFFVPDATPSGAVKLTFDFDPNDKSKTTDSNVFERGTIADVLSSVVDGNYTIGSGTCASSGVPVGAPGAGNGSGGTGTPSAVTPPSYYLPGAGAQQFTFMIAIIGTTLTVLGAIGFFLL